MIWDKILTLMKLTPGNRRAAQRLASRWSAVAEEQPALVQDVIRLGGVLAEEPKRFDEEGYEVLDPIDPYRMAIERGRRELALELLALMSINGAELQQLMEQNSDLD